MFRIAATVFSIMLAVITVSKSYVDFRDRKESLHVFLFWLLAWTAIVTIAIFPSIIDYLIADYGGGTTGLGTFFGMALVFLFFIVYRMHVKVERLEDKLVKTIQDMALREEWKNKANRVKTK